MTKVQHFCSKTKTKVTKILFYEITRNSFHINGAHDEEWLKKLEDLSL